MNNKNKTLNILLIEDNPGDILLTEEAFEESNFKAVINVARNGEEALNILNKNQGFKDIKTPDIILLDLNLPKINGHEVLNKIKQNKELRKIPVIILTSSAADEDILKSYDSYASGYIVKPVDIEKFAKVVATIEDFWFSTVLLPSK